MSSSNGVSAENGQSNEELIESKNRIRKIRIIIGVSVGILLAALLAVGIYLVIDGESIDDAKPVTGKTLSLEDILQGKLIPGRFNGSMIQDTNIIYKNLQGDIIEYNIAKNEEKLLASHTNEFSFYSIIYDKSPDNKYLLVAKNYIKLYRHSFIASYYVIDLETGLPYPITIQNVQYPLHFAKWGPVDNQLVVSYNGNLFYKPSAIHSGIQLTSDIKPNVFNGHPDWVYEEEVFSTNTAVWFNPAGTRLAYIRFDDTSTRSINLSYYGEPGNLAFQYPSESVVYYPKAGSSNPLVELYQVNLIDALELKESTRKVVVPPALSTTEHIITAVTWITNEKILSVFMNRIQNQAYVQIADENSRYEILDLPSSTGWVDLFTSPLKNRDGSKIALILPQNQGSTDGDYRHLTILSTTKNPGNPVALTSGKYVVQQILYWDDDTNVIYYTANSETSPQSLHIYGKKAEKDEKPQCLTCNMKSNGVQQTYFSAEFGPSGKYAVITSQGPGIPQSNIYEISFVNNNAELKLVKEWEANKDINSVLSGIQLPKRSIHTIDLGNGFTSKALLLLPPNADLSGKTKYPMLVDVYGGPDSYSVVDKWSLDWGTYLTSNHSVIYAKIDGRGSGLRGDKLLHSIYLKLGTFEIDDQIQTAKKLQETLPYIDATRMGIWGWSYGGYAAAMALAKDDKKVFQCAASVAPVTDWAYYDSIYTERYMSLPMHNRQGYENAQLTSIATKLRGKQYLLVHGTLDDNVHYQQAMVLAKVLEENDIMFKQISYPDEDHGLIRVRPHLYHSLDRFFKDCLKWK